MEQNKNKKRIWLGILALIGLLCANLVYLLTVWLASKYDKVTLDQFIYQMKSSAAGANRSLAKSAWVRVGVYGLIYTFVEVLIYFIISGKLRKLLHDNKVYLKLCATNVCRFITKRALPLALALLAISCTFFTLELDVVHYVKALATDSTFIEEEYVNPNDVKITFPEKKRNLIYIFLESMEVAYADTEAGGPITDNFIPELAQLAEDYINFSHDDDLGGAQSFSGTTWTAAALVSQTSGVAVQVPLTAGRFGGTEEDSQFMPGIVTIGEVLEDAGYQQYFLMGSDSDFGGRDTYFTKHGNYEILDTKALKAAGRLPEDYRKWWGFEDKKLWEYAKEELTRLSESDQPFNFTMLTCDSHFPNGYRCEDCGKEYNKKYPNVLHCCSIKVLEFINWCKQQPFYENTTIVLCGDHLTMDPKFFADVNPDYQRTIYNCIINAPVEPVNEKNRVFGTFDMFPTTLGALGVEIEGDRLGLGTNLFSETPTLAEQYGFDYVDYELQKNSDYYNSKFLDMYEMPLKQEEDETTGTSTTGSVPSTGTSVPATTN